jgi:hypothetical protein
MRYSLQLLKSRKVIKARDTKALAPSFRSERLLNVWVWQRIRIEGSEIVLLLLLDRKSTVSINTPFSQSQINMEGKLSLLSLRMSLQKKQRHL